MGNLHCRDKFDGSTSRAVHHATDKNRVGTSGPIIERTETIPGLTTNRHRVGITVIFQRLLGRNNKPIFGDFVVSQQPIQAGIRRRATHTEHNKAGFVAQGIQRCPQPTPSQNAVRIGKSQKPSPRCRCAEISRRISTRFSLMQ